jgi:hypothetical protein
MLVVDQMELYAIAAATFGALMLLLTTRELLRRRIGFAQYCFWTTLWFAMILLGTVPQFYSALLVLTETLGMLTPIHFVTTFSILILFAAVYLLEKRVGELDKKLSKVVQHIALQEAGDRISSQKEQKK